MVSNEKKIRNLLTDAVKNALDSMIVVFAEASGPIQIIGHTDDVPLSKKGKYI